MTTRSWLRDLLTTVLARVTKRDTSTAQPQLGWNGRPLGATQDKRNSGPMPATDYSTLVAFQPWDGTECAAPKRLVPLPEKAIEVVAVFRSRYRIEDGTTTPAAR